ncbi:recombinase family protein [Clostridium botulinum D/C]|uniref:recombinase family protein n=1 Tax=Clostridium botulinum TaxID=1491 RepID=UPI001E41D40A|nr:recombinase family protein [Clostridium botulinum]MCD3234308.1 recombinase family protein [Clostridium botulinum D/C]MCD3240292.1 recombinase family protein [Clostridium botulinum D/C]MCD3267727.1 recombinase family protein [Clostridium botulinum D/C]MCD3306124.1 recombinase family protein [Clostridium botulinum D/C]MCD3314908.1 recombinase family protein [Clostridium botulinum D/C]
MKKIYGYLRVSTLEQNTGRQREALKRYEKENNIKIDCIFEDKASGKNFNRPQYKVMKELAKKGDTIIVKELDRLGRNYDEIKAELSQFNLLGIKIVILDLPIMNVEDDTLNSLLNNLVIELLSYIADRERIKIVSRIREGLKNAKQNGTKSGKNIGRPSITVDELPKDFEKYYKKVIKKQITKNDMAKILGISRMTLYRYIKMFDNNTWS